MNRKVKRYDPINSNGACGTCVEDPDYGAYVEFADYAALEDERERLTAELAAEREAFAALAAEVQGLQIALRLSANRLDRLALEFPDASVMKWTVSEWAVEARAALAASTGQEVGK